MIVQHTKILNYTKPTDLFIYTIDTYKDEQYMKDYVLSVSRTEILKDYASMKKIMVTDVLPLGEKDYDKDSLDFANMLGWEFTLYQDDSTCPLYDGQDWLESWNCYHYDDVEKYVLIFVQRKRMDTQRHLLDIRWKMYLQCLKLITVVLV